MMGPVLSGLSKETELTRLAPKSRSSKQAKTSSGAAAGQSSATSTASGLKRLHEESIYRNKKEAQKVCAQLRSGKIVMY